MVQLCAVEDEEVEVEIGGGYNKRGLDHSKEVTRSLQLLPSSLFSLSLPKDCPLPLGDDAL